MVGTVPVSTAKPIVTNPYAKKTGSQAKKMGSKKAKKATTWNHRWQQTASTNDRKTKRGVIVVSSNSDPMEQVGGPFHYKQAKPKPGTIMPHPSNPAFFLPTQHSEDESTDSEDEVEVDDEVEVSRRISLSPPLAQSQESPPSSPEKLQIKKENAPITATITFHDDDFVEGIEQHVSENIGDLLLSYYASQQTSSKKISSV